MGRRAGAACCATSAISRTHGSLTTKPATTTRRSRSRPWRNRTSNLGIESHSFDRAFVVATGFSFHLQQVGSPHNCLVRDMARDTLWLPKCSVMRDGPSRCYSASCFPRVAGNAGAWPPDVRAASRAGLAPRSPRAGRAPTRCWIRLHGVTAVCWPLLAGGIRVAGGRVRDCIPRRAAASRSFQPAAEQKRVVTSSG
jgi:hypothetical protein